MRARPLRRGLAGLLRTGMEYRRPLLERAWSSVPADAGNGPSVEAGGPMAGVDRPGTSRICTVPISTGSALWMAFGLSRAAAASVLRSNATPERPSPVRQASNPQKSPQECAWTASQSVPQAPAPHRRTSLSRRSAQGESVGEEDVTCWRPRHPDQGVPERSCRLILCAHAGWMQARRRPEGRSAPVLYRRRSPRLDRSRCRAAVSSRANPSQPSPHRATSRSSCAASRARSAPEPWDPTAQDPRRCRV